jgi:ABC-type antimicrobial peptide transport system permease subunit
MGTALTVVVCVLAGIGPARHAARNNIVDAMQAR